MSVWDSQPIKGLASLRQLCWRPANWKTHNQNERTTKEVFSFMVWFEKCVKWHRISLANFEDQMTEITPNDLQMRQQEAVSNVVYFRGHQNHASLFVYGDNSDFTERLLVATTQGRLILKDLTSGFGTDIATKVLDIGSPISHIFQYSDSLWGVVLNERRVGIVRTENMSHQFIFDLDSMSVELKSSQIANIIPTESQSLLICTQKGDLLEVWCSQSQLWHQNRKMETVICGKLVDILSFPNKINHFVYLNCKNGPDMVFVSTDDSSVLGFSLPQNINWLGLPQPDPSQLLWPPNPLHLAGLWSQSAPKRDKFTFA